MFETIGAGVLLAILLSTLIEGIVEYFASPIFETEKTKSYSWVLRYISLILGVVLSLEYQLDLVSYVVNLVFPDFLLPSLGGYILTGVIIGRGGSYVHDFVGLFKMRIVEFGGTEEG